MGRASPRRLWALFLLTMIGLAPAVAQNPGAVDDRTEARTPQKAPKSKPNEALGRVPPAQAKEVLEPEQDDPAARYEWLRRAMGEVTPQRKRELIREAERKSRAYPHLQPRPPAPAGRTQPEPYAANPDNPIAPSSSGIPQWIQIGPSAETYEQNGAAFIETTVSGRLRRILVHPTDPNTVYVLSSGGGLWRTNNFQSTPPNWAVLTDALPTTSGGSVAFGRSPAVLYLGLGDPWDTLLPGGAMVKSIDGGNTWSAPMDLGNAVSVRDVAVDTSGPQDVVMVATDVGLFRSADSGSTYQQVAAGSGQTLQNMQIWSIVRTSAGWLLSAELNSGVGGNFGGTGGLFFSTDTGVSWNPTTNSNNVFSGAGRTTLAVGLPGDSVVYAFAASCNDSRYALPNCDEDQWDLFRSSDGGQNWTALGLRNKVPLNPIPNSNDQNDMDVMHGQAFYNQMLGVDPTDPSRNTVYIGGNLTSDKSTDGGQTWTILTDWFNGYYGVPYVHADFHTITFATGSGGPLVLVGCDGGIFTSSDGGASWLAGKNTGLENFLVYTLTSTPSFPGSIFAGTQDNGTRVRSGQSGLFNGSLGGDGTGLGWSQANHVVSIGSATDSTIRRNLSGRPPDLIENWEPATTGIDRSTAGFFSPVATPSAKADPTGLVFFTSTPQYLYQTTDGGFNWYAIGNATSSFTIRSMPHIIAVGPSDLLHLAVGGNSGQLAFTTNGGASYTTVALNSLVSGFASFLSSEAWGNNSTLYAASVAQTSGAVRVAKSTNIGSGNTFVRADFGLPDVPVYKLLADPSDATGNTVLAATYVGVYRTTDGGQTWLPYGAGLPSVRVSDIYMPPDGSYIRIGTYGRGIWELPQLAFESATLTDDVQTCNGNGVLENGEKGHFALTLRNSSGNDLTSVTATITTTNTNVSFPNGNVVNFPAVPANGTATASVVVALGGAAGVQQADFTAAFSDPALGLPSPVTALASFRVNYVEVASASDDAEAGNTTWTVTGSESVPQIVNWKRSEVETAQHRWVGLDSNRPSDQSLVSPVLHVGNSAFTFSFVQRYSFEFDSVAWYDGGVVELSQDGGATWTDLGPYLSPGYDHPLATGGGNPLEGRMAYAGRSGSYPGFVPVTANLGTAYAGKNVRIRFRIGTDIEGFGPGWTLDNFSFTGLTNTPFTALSASAGCAAPSLTLSMTADSAVVSAGSDIGFTVAVAAAAGAPAITSVSINDPLPAGTGVNWGISPAYQGPGTCSIAGAAGSQTLTCSLGDLAAGAGASVHVSSATAFAGAGLYSNAATATAGNAPNAMANASVTVQAPALSVSQTADSVTVDAGSSIGFTVTVANSSAAGTGTASSVTLADALPAGTAVSWSVTPAYSGPGTCSITGAVGSQILNCVLGNLAPAASATVHVASATAYASAGSYPSTVTMSAGNAPTLQANAGVTVLAPALSVSNGADATAVGAGTIIGFTVAVNNSGAPGTGKAASVSISDPLPSGSGVSWSISPSYNGPGSCSIIGATGSQILNCTLGDIAAGAGASVHVSSATSFTSAGAYPSTVTASATNAPTATANASIAVQVPVLSISNTADVSSVSTGETIGFTIAVGNSNGAGTLSATNVTISDPLPGGAGVAWSLSPAYNGPGTCSIAGAPGSQVLGCALGTLTPGAAATVHVTSTTVFASAGTFSSVATASAGNHPNVAASASLTVKAPALAVTNVPDLAKVNPGSNLGFTVVISNGSAAGTGTAMGVALNDPLPAGTGISWVISPAYSGPGTCSITGSTGSQVLNCAVGNLSPGASASVHLVSATSSGSSGTYSSTAAATASNAPGANATTSVTVQQPPTLSPGSIDFGQQLIYTGHTISATFTNNDGLALSVNNVSLTGGFSQSNNCPANLGSGASCSVTVAFQPGSLGAKSGTLSISYGNGSAVSVPLSGIATDITLSLGLSGRPARPTRSEADPVITGQAVHLSDPLAWTSAAPLTPGSPMPSSFMAGSTALVASPDRLEFEGPESAGTSSRTIRLTNRQARAVRIFAVQVTGDFLQEGDCAAELASGASCEITVRWAALLGARQTGELRVTSDAGSITVKLSRAGATLREKD